MGKDADDAHADGACCHACERWANAAAGTAPAPSRIPGTIEPGTVAFQISQRGTPVGVYAMEAEGITIGRGKQCNLALDDMALSRVQAYVILRDGKLYVKDSGSSCGTFVDGKLIGNAMRIGEGSTISFGNHDLVVIRRT
jgi:pSer/pThr/pTyr-binding forkhead associated (FHA) protein